MTAILFTLVDWFWRNKTSSDDQAFIPSQFTRLIQHGNLGWENASKLEENDYYSISNKGKMMIRKELLVLLQEQAAKKLNFDCSKQSLGNMATGFVSELL